jgi:Mn-dependent DtxR family transcriptional regulator
LKKQFARRDSKKALVKVIVQSFKVNEPLAELLITQLKDNGYLKDIGNDRYELTEEAIVTIASTRGGSHG